MNTFGKILVVCVFIIAIAAIAFMGVDFATRNNWKTYSKALSDELEVFKGRVQLNDKTNADLNIQVKRAEEDKKTVEVKLKEMDDDFKQNMIKKGQEVDDANIKAKEADLNLQASLAETDRLKLEVAGLQTTLKKREALIVALEEEKKKFQNDTITARNESRTMQGRNVNLMEKLRSVERLLAEVQNKGTGGTLTSIIRDPNAPNPPAVAVKGQVDKVNPQDKSLVQLSVGTDHGVNKNHTLEVFRMQPRAEYLGTIRIIDSFPHYSVGKIMRSSMPHSPLQAGDTVVGTIGP